MSLNLSEPELGACGFQSCPEAPRAWVQTVRSRGGETHTGEERKGVQVTKYNQVGALVSDTPLESCLQSPLGRSVFSGEV